MISENNNNNNNTRILRVDKQSRFQPSPRGIKQS